MRVVFRVDSGLQIGSGHVERCLTLARELRRRSVDCVFVSRLHRANRIVAIEEAGFTVETLAAPEPKNSPPPVSRVPHASWLGVPTELDAQQTLNAIGGTSWDWLVVDHYGIDKHWTALLRPSAAKVMVIDDLADRHHDADVLLDQNLFESPQARYRDRIPSACRTLLGPSYAMLREEFARARSHGTTPNVRHDTQGTKRLLVFMGGMDQDDVTGRVLRSIAANIMHGLTTAWRIDVVAGGQNPHLEKLRQQCQSLSHRLNCTATLSVDIDDMSRRMMAADAAVTAGGSVTWERCCTGVAAAVITVAENQIAVAELLSRQGVCDYFGFHANLPDETLASRLATFMDPIMSSNHWRSLAEHAGRLVDGLGVQRVADGMLGPAVRVAA